MSTINLLPDNYLKQRAQRRSNTVCLILFVIVVSSVVGAYAMTERSKNHTLDIRDRINAEYKDAVKLIDQMQVLEAQKTVMLEKAQLTASLVERVPRSTLLAILTNARPKGTSLSSVEITTRKVKKSKRSRKGRLTASGKSVITASSRGAQEGKIPIIVEITVMGLAGTDKDVAQFMSAVANNPLIDSVDLDFSQEKIIKKIPVREFQVRVVLKNDVDATEMFRTSNPNAPVASDGSSQQPEGNNT